MEIIASLELRVGAVGTESLVADIVMMDELADELGGSELEALEISSVERVDLAILPSDVHEIAVWHDIKEAPGDDAVYYAAPPEPTKLRELAARVNGLDASCHSVSVVKDLLIAGSAHTVELVLDKCSSLFLHFSERLTEVAARVDRLDGCMAEMDRLSAGHQHETVTMSSRPCLGTRAHCLSPAARVPDPALAVDGLPFSTDDMDTVSAPAPPGSAAVAAVSRAGPTAATFLAPWL